MPKKKFIDKKNAVTFHLVHRSQRDPLQASEDVGQRVLLAQNAEPEKRKEEQREFGVYYDDDYDYLQHLKDVNEINQVGFDDEEVLETFRLEPKQKPKGKGNKGLNLPSTVFGSEMETEVGMLNKAAPQSGPKLDWDPDIVAALDDDFDYEDPDNMLDDDFMAAANAEGGVKLADEDVAEEKEGARGGFFPVGDGEEYSDSEEEEDEEEEMERGDIASDEADNVSDLGSLDDGFSFTDEETKSRFTQYSVTSSVIRRNQGLSLLDDRFEKFFEQYDDEELGALEHEEIDGNLDPNSKILTSMMKEFQTQQTRPKLKDVIEKVENLDVDSGSENNDIEFEMRTEGPKEKWDCESILSTYSNLYNHPTLIKEEKRKKTIVVDQKSGLPMEQADGPGLSLKDVQREMNARNREDKACTYRPDNETTEERKARKGAVKEERKARREEKKATKIAFRKEGIKQDKERINAARNEGMKMS